MPFVWCLLIDRDHEPSFGEPIFEWAMHTDSIHQLKLKLKMGDNNGDFDSDSPANRIEIWKCKTLKLSHKDTLTRLKGPLSKIKFSEDEDGDVQLLAAGQSMRELGLEADELLLVVVP